MPPTSNKKSTIEYLPSDHDVVDTASDWLIAILGTVIQHIDMKDLFES